MLALVLTTGLRSAGIVWAAGYDPQVGTRHPDFSLPDIRTGKPVSLSDFRGRKVLPWCRQGHGRGAVRGARRCWSRALLPVIAAVASGSAPR
jgi:hypothetical protein